MVYQILSSVWHGLTESGHALLGEALIGVRLGLGTLWLLVFFGVALRSWAVTEQAPERRKAAWRWLRGGLVILAVAIVGFYVPGDVLRTAGQITQEQRMLFFLVGSALNAVAAATLLVGLDIARAPRLEKTGSFITGLF